MSFTNFKASKVWEDEDNIYEQRPEKITYTLKRTKTLNGETIQDSSFSSAKTVGEKEEWSAEWKQCAAFAPDGGVFEYYIEESTVNYYTEAHIGNEKADTMVYTFTNTYEPKKRTLTAYKLWDDRDDLFNTRPATVKYELWCKYQAYEKVEVKDENEKVISTTAEPKFDNNKEVYFNGLVYDSKKALNEQSAVYQAMLACDPTLIGDKAANYFAKVLDENDKVGTDKNLWKVEFDNLPDKVNGLADNVFAGKSVDVTYYIKETVDESTAKIYQCPEESDELFMLQYGKAFTDKEVTADNSILTVPKSYAFDGIQYLEIPDLQSDDIFGNHYHYYLKEVDSSGNEVTNSKVKTEESAFHDNSNGKTTVLVTNELPKLYFKIQRKIEDKADFQTVTKDSDGERLKVTVNGIEYQADSKGLFAVPKTYEEITEEDTTVTKIKSFEITGLPKMTEEDASDKRTYTYSVLECNADGTAADNNTLTMTTAGDNEVTLTIEKPLGSEDANTYYKLYRKVKDKDYIYVATDTENKAITVTDTENDNKKIECIKVEVGAAVNELADVLVTTLPTSDIQQSLEFTFK